ncbi:site-2 protease family protein [Patescibacteria group bacterium]|nr:site-2 protease family protein [Patescibacteria group bacterium]
MLITIISIIVILGFLIFVHELGHFITAKRSGVKVEEFGFGYPPRLFGIQKIKANQLASPTKKWRFFWGKYPQSTTESADQEGESEQNTIYSVNWIPIGGFVKIKGEGGEQREDKNSFSHKSFAVRGLILSSGVLMNVILAVVLFAIGFMMGLPAAIDEQQINDSNVRNVKVQIASVAKDSPADESGLLLADQILEIDGNKITTVSEVQNYIKENQEEPLTLAVKSGADIKEITVKPETIEGFGENKVLGVSLVQTGIVSYNFFESWYRGALITVNLLIQIVIAFYGLFKNLILGLGLSPDLAGPVGVAVITGRIVDMGWSYIIQFVALLSLNLAVLNFLPFPALDGGRFIFLLIEKIRRKPNNQMIENLIHNLGFSLLMIFVLFITYRDLLRYGSGLIDKLKYFFS